MLRKTSSRLFSLSRSKSGSKKSKRDRIPPPLVISDPLPIHTATQPQQFVEPPRPNEIPHTEPLLDESSLTPVEEEEDLLPSAQTAAEFQEYLESLKSSMVQVGVNERYDDSQSDNDFAIDDDDLPIIDTVTSVVTLCNPGKPRIIDIPSPISSSASQRTPDLSYDSDKYEVRTSAFFHSRSSSQASDDSLSNSSVDTPITDLSLRIGNFFTKTVKDDSAVIPSSRIEHLPELKSDVLNDWRQSWSFFDDRDAADGTSWRHSVFCQT